MKFSLYGFVSCFFVGFHSYDVHTSIPLPSKENIYKKKNIRVSHEYLLATELYMVETWEKVVIHIIFLTVFALFWYFNYSIVLNSIQNFRSNHLLQES